MRRNTIAFCAILLVCGCASRPASNELSANCAVSDGAVPVSLAVSDVSPLTLPSAPAPSPLIEMSIDQDSVVDASRETSMNSSGDAGNPEDRWHFVIAPYGWAASIVGDVEVGSTRADIDTKFKDVLDDLSYGLEVRMEAWKGKWRVTIDPSLLVLESEASAGGVDVESKSTVSLVGFGLNRVLYEATAEDGERWSKIEAGIGGIWTSVRSEIDFSGAVPDVDERASWVDPTVSLRATTRLSDRWSARIVGAVGGFDVGEASKFTWGAETFLGYRLSPQGNKTLFLGYRALGIERSRGMLEVDLVMHGPVLGVAFEF